MLWTCCSVVSAVAGGGDLPANADSARGRSRRGITDSAPTVARSCLVEIERLIAVTIRSTSGNAAYS